MKTQHPFIDRTSLVIVGDHVTLESGTGCVHTAPGHGIEDFVVCKNYPEIPIIVPVDAKGRLTEEAGMFAGLTTEEANKPIALHLEKIGALFALKKIEHQYPHCWRCHKPVIFRATSQWFCSVDDFKDDAVKAAEDVKWFLNGVRTVCSQWLRNVLTGVFLVRENGAFQSLLYIARIAARKSLTTIL